MLFSITIFTLNAHTLMFSPISTNPNIYHANVFCRENVDCSLCLLHSCSAYPGSELVVANTLTKWKKLEPDEINFSQG